MRDNEQQYIIMAHCIDGYEKAIDDEPKPLSWCNMDLQDYWCQHGPIRVDGHVVEYYYTRRV